MNEITELAAFLSSVQLEDVPEQVQEAAAFHILDSIGTALGASNSTQVKAISDRWFQKGNEGTVSIWGQNRKSDLSTGVFLNALMGHTQEMDDVHTNSKTHIGTVVIPAAWGMAEALGASGKELLLSVICGYETMSRIGMAFGVSSHRNRGWHVTATAGTFGAAAACAKLLKLDAEKTAYALGLAGAQSFGTWAFLGDGASCKVLNPARASQAGMESAILAQAGMTGPVHVLTAEDGGILKMMSDEPEIDQVVRGLGTIWQLLYMDNKPYPSCRSTHCTIDGSLEIRRKYGLKAEDIDHVEVETYSVGYKQCGVSPGSIKPETPVHAKFSTPYTVACAFLYGEVTMKHFEQNAIGDCRVQDLLKRVTVIPKEEFTSAYPKHWGCRVRAYDKYGKQYEAYVKDASGSVDNPLTAEQVKGKAISLMKENCGDRTEQIADMLLHIRDARKICAL